MCGLSYLFILAVASKTGFIPTNADPIDSWVNPLISTPDGKANLTMTEGTLGNTSIIVRTTPAATAYVIADQTVQDMFTIYTELGLLVVNEYETNYEQGMRSFRVVIEAEAPDSSTATASLTVYLTDVNDEAPVFSSSLYKAVVPDNTQTGGDVIGLTVSDADETPDYRSVILSIADGNTDDLFTIFDDGMIKVAERKNLYNATGYYLTVRASDGVNEGFTNVIIGICNVTSTGSCVIGTGTALITLIFDLILIKLKY